MNDKIKDNTLGSLARYFHDVLDPIYLDKGELKAIKRLLFESLFGLHPAALEIRKSETVSESEILKFHFAVKKLRAGEPIQYVLGHTEFLDLKIGVSPAVLIPRPETEELVRFAVREITPGSRVLDIGTGSGCIALGIKKMQPEAQVMACDVSEEALKVAKRNAEANDLSVDFFRMDILHPLENLDAFDVIISNPPYVLEKDKLEMETHVLDYEPGLALFVPDENPLIFYQAIAKFAQKNLKAGGKLFFECHRDFAQAIADYLKSSGFQDVAIHKDIFGEERFLSANSNFNS